MERKEILFYRHYYDDSKGTRTTKGFKNLCIIGPRKFGKSLNMDMFECFMDGYCSGNEEVKSSNKEAL